MDRGGEERDALRRSDIIHKKNAELDQRSLLEQEQELSRYLQVAFLHYLRCLALSTPSDLPAYKMLALWLQNCHQEALSNMVAQEWPRIKCHQMVPLLQQMVARMSTSNSAFTRALDTILGEPWHLRLAMAS
ncbi:serine/threonine-protein kinase tel1-like [Hyalella azteca]|uniref:Serine/threonine-protein kinase tel1-like n=1 Tax=Hyalella azteca TaxID=294128 RepID=A0A979FJU8_HYAAZ|nr:serine/threonine-protein kinase tel1-like [Hyalella azteca]